MKFVEKENIIVARFDDGEDFIGELQGIISFGKPLKIILSGLGMFRNVKLGYFESGKYIEHLIPEPVEVLALSGSFMKNADPPYHIHAVVGMKNGQVKGGHLLQADVWNTLELFLILSDLDLRRNEKKHIII